MTWQTQVASWVIPLVAEYVIPDDAQVITGIEFGTLDDGTADIVLQDSKTEHDYPGIVPDFSLDPELTPTTGGTQYNLKAKKAVGFYGVDCSVLSYNDKRLNRWAFPLVRRNFGFLALSRYQTVMYDSPLHYSEQYHISEAVQSLVLNYDDDFSVSNLFNSADKFCLTKVAVFLYPEVVLRVRFLPIYEVWAIRFLQQGSTTCSQRKTSTPPNNWDGLSDTPPPWPPTTILQTPGNPAGGYAILACPDGDEAETDPVWQYFFLS